MKKIFTIILIGLLFTSCGNDDDGIDCALFDPAFSVLYIRIVDNSGNNLIENGTIHPNDISVDGDFSGASFQFIPADELSSPDATVREFDNTIRLFIPDQPTFQYTIRFNEAHVINIDFTAELTRIPCNLSYFTPNRGIYNDEALELTEVSSLQVLAIIEI